MARTIKINETTVDARSLTKSAADENEARLDDLETNVSQCGEVETYASDAITSLRPLIQLQRDMATALDNAVRANADTLADAKQAVRDGVSVFGSGFGDREREIATKTAALDVLHVRRMRERLGKDEAARARAEKLATTAADSIRTLKVEIDKRRDALVMPPMNRTIEAIMNEESARQSWRARPNAMVEARDLYARLCEREQTDEQIQFEMVIAPVCMQIRDTPQIKIAARKAIRQPTVTEDDRSIAIQLLQWFDRSRIARLPEWLHVGTWMHSQLAELFALIAGYHGRYVSLDEFMRRRTNANGERDAFEIHPEWVWRGHPSTADMKRRA